MPHHIGELLARPRGTAKPPKILTPLLQQQEEESTRQKFLNAYYRRADGERAMMAMPIL